MNQKNPDRSLGQHVVLGSAWMIAMRWSMRLVGLVSTVILARLLVPDDFGVVAMAMVVVALLEVIALTGVDLALIRDDKATREHYDTAWTVRIIQGLIVATLLLLVAPTAGYYFDEPRVTSVIQLLALKSPIDGLQNIGVVAFRKELDFAKEFRFNLYKKLINFIIIVSAAFTFRSYWALALGMLSAATISTLLSYAMHPYRPRLSLSRFNDIWSFSQWLLVSHIGLFLNRKSDQFVIGGLNGTTAMGSYHVASEIATMPTNELVMPTLRALFPTLSKTLDDATAFRAVMLQAFAAISVMCCLLGFGLAAVADLFVPLVLGPQWLSSVPLMRWLALFGVFSALIAILEVPLWVQGKTRLSALQTWLELALLVPLLVVATLYLGVEGAAACRALVAAAAVPLMLYLVAIASPLTIADMLGQIWRPLLAGSAMASILLWLPGAPDGAGLAYLAGMLLGKGVLGALLYFALLLLLWALAGRPDGTETLALRQLSARWSKSAAGADG